MIYFMISSLLIAVHGLDSSVLDETYGAHCFAENGLRDLASIPEFSGCSAFENMNAFANISEKDAMSCGISVDANITNEEISFSFANLGLRKISDVLSNFVLCYASSVGLNFELDFDDNRIDCTSERYDALKNSDKVEFYCTQSTQNLVLLCAKLTTEDCAYYSSCELGNESGECQEKGTSASQYAVSTVRISSSSTFTDEQKRNFKGSITSSLISAVMNDANSLLSPDEQSYVQVSADVSFNKVSDDTFVLVLEVYYVVDITSAGVGEEDAHDTVNKLGASYVDFILGQDSYTVQSIVFDSKSIALENNKRNGEVVKKKSKMETSLIAAMVVVALILVIIIIFEGTVLFNAVTGPSGYRVDDAVILNNINRTYGDEEEEEGTNNKDNSDDEKEKEESEDEGSFSESSDSESESSGSESDYSSSSS